MQHKRQSDRPSSAIFADGTKSDRLLAIHPDAIGVQHRVRPAEQVAQIVDGIAVICVDGPLEHKSGGGWWCYWQTYEDLAARFQNAIADSAVRAVVLKFDSPGGEVGGLTETVKLMQRVKEASGKRVIAYVDEDCYSAAYALAMVADEIYLPESGGVGSIGVITAMVDVTAHDKKEGVRVEVIASGSKKADGHPHVPLSTGAIKRTQKRVATLAEAFFALVSETRGIGVDAIAAMQAGVFAGTEAVSVGLADGVMTLAECLTLAADVFGSTEKPTDQSEEEKNMSVLAATRSLNEANAKLAAAKTTKARATAAALVTSAEAALLVAKGESAELGTAPVAKVTKKKTVTTDTHEEEIDDGEPEDEDDEDDDAADAIGDDDDGEEDCEDDGDDAARTSAALASAPSTKDGLLAFVRTLTGKRSIGSVMGALRAMHDSTKRTGKLAAKVALLERDALATKLGAMIAKGIKAGQLAPSQRKWALTQSIDSLRAYLDTAPKQVHTVADALTEKPIEKKQDLLGAVTPDMAKIWMRQGFTEKDFPDLLARLNGSNGATGANGVS